MTQLPSLQNILTKELLDEFKATFKQLAVAGCSVVVVQENEGKMDKKAVAHGNADGNHWNEVDPHTWFPFGTDGLIISLAVLRALSEKGLTEKIKLAQVFDMQLGDLGNKTVEEVLSHQTGLPSVDPSLLNVDIPLLDSLSQIPLSKPKWHHSQLNILLAIRILEQLTGTTWNDYVQKTIFDPLDVKAVYTRPHLKYAMGVWSQVIPGSDKGRRNAEMYPLEATKEKGIWLNSVYMTRLLTALPLMPEYHKASQPLIKAISEREVLSFEDPHLPVTWGMGMQQSTHRQHRIWESRTVTFGCTTVIGRFPNLGIGWAVLTNSPEGVYAASLVKFRLLEKFTNLAPWAWKPAISLAKKKDLVYTAFLSHIIKPSHSTSDKSDQILVNELDSMNVSSSPTDLTTIVSNQQPSQVKSSLTTQDKSVSNLDVTVEGISEINLSNSPNNENDQISTFNLNEDLIPKPKEDVENSISQQEEDVENPLLRQKTDGEENNGIIGTWLSPGLKPLIISSNQIISYKPQYNIIPPWYHSPMVYVPFDNAKDEYRGWIKVGERHGKPFRLRVKDGKMNVRGFVDGDRDRELVFTKVI
ncbi:hypothetical protein M231_04427 [Tremella mesenterica]|uniref:Beta-lactamase-related domain-containing protein n=1 Tax=Tremella mesenterica TaxID=5217 RepID=A0A4Q1BKJ6_TREME|nr:hypothetical protein M231_04427 [Tremella mesenterica]